MVLHVTLGFAFKRKKDAKQKAWDGREPLVLRLKKLDLASLVTVLLPLLPYCSLCREENKRRYTYQSSSSKFTSACKKNTNYDDYLRVLKSRRSVRVSDKVKALKLSLYNMDEVNRTDSVRLTLLMSHTDP